MKFLKKMFGDTSGPKTKLEDMFPADYALQSDAAQKIFDDCKPDKDWQTAHPKLMDILKTRPTIVVGRLLFDAMMWRKDYEHFLPDIENWLNTCEATYGRFDLRTLSAYVPLGLLHAKLKNEEKAKLCFVYASEVFTDVLEGKAEEEAGLMLYWYGDAFGYLGNRRVADELRQEGLERLTATDVLTTKAVSRYFYDMMHTPAQRERLLPGDRLEWFFETLKSLTDRHDGFTSKRWFYILNAATSAYTADNRLAAADRLYVDTLDDVQQGAVDRGDDPAFGHQCAHVEVLLAMGEIDRAEARMLQILTEKADYAGDPAWVDGRTRMLMAKCYQANGKFDKAEAQLLAARDWDLDDDAAERFNLGSSAHREATFKLAALYEDIGKLDQAENVLLKQYALVTSSEAFVRANEYHDVFKTIDDCTAFYERTGQLQKAADFGQKLVDANARAHGYKSKLYLQAVKRVGQTLDAAGDWQTAKDYYTDAAAVVEAEVGVKSANFKALVKASDTVKPQPGGPDVRLRKPVPTSDETLKAGLPKGYYHQAMAAVKIGEGGDPVQAEQQLTQMRDALVADITTGRSLDWTYLHDKILKMQMLNGKFDAAEATCRQIVAQHARGSRAYATGKMLPSLPGSNRFWADFATVLQHNRKLDEALWVWTDLAYRTNMVDTARGRECKEHWQGLRGQAEVLALQKDWPAAEAAAEKLLRVCHSGIYAANAAYPDYVLAAVSVFEQSGNVKQAVAEYEKALKTIEFNGKKRTKENAIPIRTALDALSRN